MAVHECIDRYSPLVWSLARRHVRQHADAEDAVQEIFVEVWRNAGRFDPAIASESTFISTISRRRLIDRQRKLARAPLTQPIVEEPPESRPSHADQVDPQLDAQQARQLMDRLRADERRVLEMSLLEGLSQSQIAEAASMPLGTVKTHARRGLKRLREMLGVEHEPNPSEDRP